MAINEEAYCDSFLLKLSMLQSTDCQVFWMRRMLKYVLQEQHEPTTMLSDNNFSIALSNNYVFHKKTKNIDTRYHFIRVILLENW